MRSGDTCSCLDYNSYMYIAFYKQRCFFVSVQSKGSWPVEKDLLISMHRGDDNINFY